MADLGQRTRSGAHRPVRARRRARASQGQSRCDSSLRQGPAGRPWRALQRRPRKAGAAHRPWCVRVEKPNGLRAAAESPPRARWPGWDARQRRWSFPRPSTAPQTQGRSEAEFASAMPHETAPRPVPPRRQSALAWHARVPQMGPEDRTFVSSGSDNQFARLTRRAALRNRRDACISLGRGQHRDTRNFLHAAVPATRYFR
jgi:hypothetical protein